MAAEVSPVPETAAIAAVTPVSSTERLPAVDVLRGFAVFGILLVNIKYFSTPLYAAMGVLPWWSHPLDRGAAWLISVLAEGKFYILFSFLFGLGMALQMERVEARGGRFGRLYARRLMVLLLIGLGHMFLLWYGDILTTYALVGFLLLLFRRRRNKTLLIWAACLYVLPVLMFSGCAGMVSFAKLWPESREAVTREFAQMEAEMPIASQESIALYADGGVADVFAARVQDIEDMLIAYPFLVPTVLALFLLGAYAGRCRWLHDLQRLQTALRRTLIWCLPTGLIICLGAGLVTGGHSPIWPSWAALAGMALHAVGSPLLGGGYAAAVLLALQSDTWRPAAMHLAAVGRMALSNYLLQTLICTTLFYGYGAGWYGKVGPAAGVALTVAIYALQVVFSRWWLARFHFGPCEWLWRSLTYAKLQPMRRARTGAM